MNSTAHINRFKMYDGLLLTIYNDIINLQLGCFFVKGQSHLTFFQGGSTMANFKYINPLDQPTGVFRLIDWLESNFLCDDFQHFCCLVAFAKIKPFYKLHNSIQLWNGKGKDSKAIIGIDHKGTSIQALQYALSNFDNVDILHLKYATFHPKLYLFYGATKASAYYGSSNFTSGGLETNFEGGVLIDFELPNDQTAFNDLLNQFNVLSAPTCSCSTTLTPAFLNILISKNLLLDETIASPRTTASAATPSSGATPSATSSSGALFGTIPIKPARPIPKSIMLSAASSSGIVINPPRRTSKKSSAKIAKGISASTSKSAPKASSSYIIPVVVDGFVIQVSPHNNGEIHLSKLATDQNAPFFHYPFTGMTVPKKPSNPSYPQCVPDPIVNIRVFDSTGSLVNTVLNYSLNTIYYTKKSEIRITITPSILNGLNLAPTANYPILVMRTSAIPGCDYDLDFYAEGSTDYNNYLALCNQSLPSGVKPSPRKMGWF